MTCLFGPPGALPLLSAVSLEQFALAVDPPGSDTRPISSPDGLIRWLSQLMRP